MLNFGPQNLGQGETQDPGIPRDPLVQIDRFF